MTLSFFYPLLTDKKRLDTMTQKETSVKETEKKEHKEIQERVFKLLEQQMDKHIDVLLRLKDK